MLARDDLHGLRPSFELLVEPLDDIAGPEGYPFFFREVEERETCIEGFLQAPYG